MTTFEFVITLLTPILLTILSVFLLPRLKDIAGKYNSETLAKLAELATIYTEGQMEQVSGKEKLACALQWLEARCKENGVPYLKEVAEALVNKEVLMKNVQTIFSHKNPADVQAVQDATSALFSKLQKDAADMGSPFGTADALKLIQDLTANLKFTRPNTVTGPYKASEDSK